MSNPPVAFVTTRWTRVIQAGDSTRDDGQAALASLCQDYWRPLFHFARRKGQSPEDAQDLTQSFLCELLETNALARADRERGRFRTFCSRPSSISWRRSIAAARPKSAAAGQVTLSLEAEAEAGFEPSAGGGRTPAEEFERSWALAMLDRVMGRLRDEYARAGRRALFDGLHPRLSGRGRPPKPRPPREQSWA